MKRILVPVLLVVLLASGGSGFNLDMATANPIGAPIVGSSSVEVGDSTTVRASWDTDEEGAAVLQATSDIGEFTSAVALAGNDIGTVTGIGTSSLSIGDDVDNLLEGATGVSADFKCTSVGTTRFTVLHEGVTSGESGTLTCVEPSNGGGGGGGPVAGLLDVYQVVVTSSPNLLPCTGGTAVLTAEAVDVFGNELPLVEFRFFTDAGTLVQTSRNTAKLTLGANQIRAVVRATYPDAEADQVEEATTVVQLDCNGDASTQTLVVTASPNVIDCTGTSTITASVRDRNGHVVPGRGFHFVTDNGLLVVDPNNASNEEGVATLTLRPGDGDATVIVSSGLLVGTYEEADDIENEFVVDETAMVTVQQNCLGTTTGQILINSSRKDITCGENVFIGLNVVDEDLQTVVNDTPITLIASAGGFYAGGESALEAAQVPTTNGEANTIYTAPENFNGQVRITAASGDVYGIITLNVSCLTAPATGSGTGANAPATPRCTPIGDGVCITPPNTGRNQITPPTTGDAGLVTADDGQDGP